MATSTNEFKVGDKVVFGRTHGEQTEGTVIKVNPSKLKVRQDEVRGSLRLRPEGTIWSVPPSLCRKVGQTAASVAPATTLKVGQTVEYTGFSWAARGQAQVQGVVTQVTVNGIEVYGEGRTQVFQASQVKAVPARPFATVKDAISGVYGHLSPENLTCDGELSRSQVATKAAQLHRALKALFVEAGREITESEAYGLPAYKGETTPVSRTAPAKQSGLKVGDKVTFTAKGQTITGFVKRVSTKTVSVQPVGETNPNRYWRVSPGLLSKAA